MSLDDVTDKYICFYTDYAFKRFFGTESNKDVLIGFLNALFEGREQVEDITYLPVEQMPDSEGERRAVFDVYCKSVTGERFMVEMQKGNQSNFKDRTLYYSTFPIRHQAQKGDWNYELSRVYSINLLNFTFDDKNDGQYIHEVSLLDTKTKEEFTDKLRFIYIEIPKFCKKEKELDSLLEKWIFAMKYMSELRSKPKGFEEAIFNRLFELAEIAKFSPSEYFYYEESMKQFRDFNNVLNTAKEKAHAEGKEEGVEIGREEGIEIGREEGIEIGKEEGRREEKKETAKHLLRLGMPIETIAEITKLSIEEINNIYEQ